MKTGRLSKKEVETITESKLSDEELARKLNRSTVTIRKQRDENVATLKAGDLLAKRNGAVVMTPASSELSDEKRKSHKLPKDNSKYIHKFKK